jgi:hypothetical protein
MTAKPDDDLPLSIRYHWPSSASFWRKVWLALIWPASMLLLWQLRRRLKRELSKWTRSTPPTPAEAVRLLGHEPKPLPHDCHVPTRQHGGRFTSRDAKRAARCEHKSARRRNRYQ